MHEWNIQFQDKWSINLASDARLGSVDFCNDHIWELTSGIGEPPALSIATTFGLRAKIFRLFPRFVCQGITLDNPNEFHLKPTLIKIYPNCLRIHFSPFEGIDVLHEYCVPESQALMGHIKITNNGRTERQLQLEWVAQLIPTKGSGMTPQTIQKVETLAGESDELHPVLLFKGGATNIITSPFPAIVNSLKILPTESKEFFWTLVTHDTVESSFERAQQLLKLNWEGYRARLEMLNQGNIEIRTGNPDWDFLFEFAQRQAVNLVFGTPQHLSHPVFVTTRQPDYGYSLRGNGSDYSATWCGQHPLDTYYLTRLLLPICPEMPKGWINNLLTTQEEDGFVDLRPGLVGQHGRFLATPILATMVWSIYENTNDKSFLNQVFAGLLRFLRLWFSSAHDRDGDGIPEWDHPVQYGWENHPTYSTNIGNEYPNQLKGIDITTAETPSLAAFLYAECNAILQIAEVLNHKEDLSDIRSHKELMKEFVQSCWSKEDCCYFNRDRDSHLSFVGELLNENSGLGKLTLKSNFKKPVRLFFTIKTQEGTTRSATIIIHGKDSARKPCIEKITPSQMKWKFGQCNLTTNNVFRYVKQIEFLGLQPGDIVSCYIVGHKNMELPLLTPLWAGLPDAESACLLVEKILTNPALLWHAFGISSFTYPSENTKNESYQLVDLPWNCIIGEGLIRYGFQTQAAELVTRMMNAIVNTFYQYGGLRSHYSPEDGKGFGERNALSGLPPLGLFLETLGIHLLSSNQIRVSGFNPFPWPITVKYRGLTIDCQSNKRVFTFIDGQSITIDDPSPRLVTLESDRKKAI